MQSSPSVHADPGPPSRAPMLGICASEFDLEQWRKSLVWTLGIWASEFYPRAMEKWSGLIFHTYLDKQVRTCCLTSCCPVPQHIFRDLVSRVPASIGQSCFGGTRRYYTNQVVLILWLIVSESKVLTRLQRHVTHYTACSLSFDCLSFMPLFFLW